MNKDNTQATAALFDKNAQSYQDRFMDTSLYHDSFDLFCEWITQSGASILDVACGPGNISHYLLHKRPDLILLGIDLAPNMLALAKSNNPHAELQLMDARDIKTLGRQFDGVMCGFCLPYLSRAEAIQLITDACAILAPGGLLYLSTMEDDYSKSGLQTSSTGEQLYMYFHEEAYLREAIRANGMAVLDLRRICYPDKNGDTITDLVIIARK